MPNKFPLKPRSKAIHVDQSETPVDGLALWAISLGVCASVIAAIAFFSAADQIGATLILVGAATLISVILEASSRGYL